MMDVTQFPIPPTIEKWDGAAISIMFNEDTVAAPTDVWIYKEKGHPPNFYFSMADIEKDFADKFVPSGAKTLCEFKGEAKYLNLGITPNNVVVNVAWYYPEPSAGFEEIKGYVSFYPGLLDCYVGSELVIPEDNDNRYGGWLWSDVENFQNTSLKMSPVFDKVMDLLDVEDPDREFSFFVAAVPKNLSGANGLGALRNFEETSYEAAITALLGVLAEVGKEGGIFIRPVKMSLFDVGMIDMGGLMGLGSGGKFEL